MILLLISHFLLLSYLLMQAGKNLDAPNAIKWTMAVLISLSLSGMLYTGSVFVNLNFGLFLWPAMFIELIVLALSWKKRTIFPLKFAYAYKQLLFLAFLFYGTYRFTNFTYRWGEWDAYAIWNLHAKFLFSGQWWQNMLSPQIKWTHADYPLNLPAMVAVFWTSLQKIVPLVPMLIAYGVYAAYLVFFRTVFNTKEGKMLGLLVTLMFLTDSFFIGKNASQMADSLLGLFYLFTIYLLKNNNSERWEGWLLAGFFAASGLWTKNEGSVFFLVTSAYVFLNYFKQRKILVSFGLGTLIPVLFFAYYKLHFAPENDLVEGQNQGTPLEKIQDLNRYLLIGSHFFKTVFVEFPLLYLIPVVLWLKRKQKFSIGVGAIIGLTFLAYMAVYVLTPRDLEWHLTTSMSRLIHQVYPSILFLLISFWKEKLPVGDRQTVL